MEERDEEFAAVLVVLEFTELPDVLVLDEGEIKDSNEETVLGETPETADIRSPPLLFVDNYNS